MGSFNPPLGILIVGTSAVAHGATDIVEFQSPARDSDSWYRTIEIRRPGNDRFQSPARDSDSWY